MTKKEGNRYTRPVSFNKTKPRDQKIEKYPAAKKNFSGFAKLAMIEKIERDEQKKKERREAKKKQTVISDTQQTYPPQEEIPTTSIPQEEPTTAEKIEQMRQQIEQKKAENHPGPKMFFPKN